ncbi:MAG: calcium-binding protein, partial [Terricaulis sp.]
NVIDGLNGADTLNGGDGDDVLIGGAAGDALNGGIGIDAASYVNSVYAVNVNLGAGTSSGGQSNGDSFLSIENLIGSQLGDVLVGDILANVIDGLNGADTLNGGDGDDVLIGGAAGDALNGGVGNDTASYAGSVFAVNVSLSTGITSGGQSNGDSFASIENLTGSQLGDVLTGDSGANIIDGLGGADTLDGGAGNDTLIGGAGDDAFVFAPGSGLDVVQGFIAGGVEDRLDFSAYAASGITYTLTQVGLDSVFDFSNGDKVTLIGVDSSALVQSDPWGWG